MKVCIITGVTREQGLGFAIARLMHEKGFKLYVGGRNVESAEALARKIDPIGKSAYSGMLNITNDDSVGVFLSRINAAEGRLDVLINNAGGSFDAGVQPLDVNFADVRGAFEVNLFGAWRMIRKAVPLLRKSESPCIVNVSSGAGAFDEPVFGLGVHPALVPGYGLSKLALNGLTVKLARQLKNDGVMINAVDPGLVATYPGMEKMGAIEPMIAAEGIVWAATLPKDGPTGKFFRNKKEVAW